ncbi:hypothetical protein AKO1_001042 [Acrasis kona]|uniref:GLTSCR protein conserved domain-containing protein n=1 Tax=Acrasis kona TaxID=1008807 RepID=A0AAW2ZBF1_9EUKA
MSGHHNTMNHDTYKLQKPTNRGPQIPMNHMNPSLHATQNMIQGQRNFTGGTPSNGQSYSPTNMVTNGGQHGVGQQNVNTLNTGMRSFSGNSVQGNSNQTIQALYNLSNGPQTQLNNFGMNGFSNNQSFQHNHSTLFKSASPPNSNSSLINGLTSLGSNNNIHHINQINPIQTNMINMNFSTNAPPNNFRSNSIPAKQEFHSTPSMQNTSFLSNTNNPNIGMNNTNNALGIINRHNNNIIKLQSGPIQNHDDVRRDKHMIIDPDYRTAFFSKQDIYNRLSVYRSIETPAQPEDQWTKKIDHASNKFVLSCERVQTLVNKILTREANKPPVEQLILLESLYQKEEEIKWNKEKMKIHFEEVLQRVQREKLEKQLQLEEQERLQQQQQQSSQNVEYFELSGGGLDDMNNYFNPPTDYGSQTNSYQDDDFLNFGDD